MPNIKPLIEAILFIQGKKGIRHTELLEIINIDESIFENEMSELISIFKHEDRGLEIKKFGNETRRFNDVNNETESKILGEIFSGISSSTIFSIWKKSISLV